MPPPSSILVYGQDPLLLETRRLVLSTAGFRVSTTFYWTEAQRLAITKAVDLILLCDSLSAEDRDRALTTISALRPHVELIIIAHLSDEVPDGPWETVGSLAGPEKMIMAARKAIAGTFETPDHKFASQNPR